MAKWTVKGERWVESAVGDDGIERPRMEPFEETYTADSPSAARWMARRAMAAGEPLADLEDTPPNPERERAEVDAPTVAEAAELLAAGQPVMFASDRAAARTGAERREYERLVSTVRVLSVTRD